MKYLFFVFLLILIFRVEVFAQSITTGNASSKSEVTTNISGGEVYTNIEVEANGEKKTLETSESGKHTLSVENESEESHTHVDVDEEGTKEADMKIEEQENNNDIPQESEEGNFFDRIIEAISNFIKNLFS